MPNLEELKKQRDELKKRNEARKKRIAAKQNERVAKEIAKEKSDLMKRRKLGVGARTLRVYICHEWMGTMDMSAEEESEQTAQLIQENFPNSMTFKHNVFPHQLDNDNPDIYIFDFGGVAPGCESSVESQYRELIRQIENHPSTLFILYSNFTIRWYTELMREEGEEFDKYHNVIFHSEKNWQQEVVDFFRE